MDGSREESGRSSREGESDFPCRERGGEAKEAVDDPSLSSRTLTLHMPQFRLTRDTIPHSCTCLKIHGMGATIPTALSLALAIRDAVPGGSPLPNDTGDEDDIIGSGSEDEVQGRIGRDEVKEGTGTRSTGGIFKLEVRTGTTVVGDEITPEDDVSRSDLLSLSQPAEELMCPIRVNDNDRTKT